MTRIPAAGSPVREVRGRDASDCRWKKKKEHSLRKGGKSRRELAFLGQNTGHSSGLYKDREERKHEFFPHFPDLLSLSIILPLLSSLSPPSL